MTDQKPTIVLVHGAFAESASWNGVIARLQEHGVRAIAAANPLRSLAGDAAYVRDVIASVDGPVVLVGHSYAGMVITRPPRTTATSSASSTSTRSSPTPDRARSTCPRARPAARSATPSRRTRSRPAATSS